MLLKSIVKIILWRKKMIKNKIFKKLILTGLSTMLISGSTAWAQTAPSTVTPGQIVKEPVKQRLEPIKAAPLIEAPEDRSEVGGSQKEIFVLNDIQFEGLSAYSKEDLHSIYANFLNKKVSLADLRKIVRDVTVKFRNDGFVLSRAALAQQKIKDGIVHIRIVEGFISDVKVVGDYKDRADLINRYAKKILKQKPVNTKDLERYLLLMDDLPGISARSILKASSSTPNGSDLIVTIDQDNAEASVGVDNFGSKPLGRYQLTAVVAANSLMGRHDRTTLRGIITSDTEELRFGDITHEQQVGSEGLRIKGRAAFTGTKPGDTVAALNLKGDSEFYALDFLYPVLRSRQKNFNVLGAFQALNSQSDLSGIEISEDKVRSVSLGGSFDFTDSYASVNQIDFGVTQGLDIFGATDDGLGRTRSNGEHTFTRFNLQATRIQDLWWSQWSVYAAAKGQYALDALLASEEFGVGGRAFGRAYDGAEILGDHGAAGALELRYSRNAQSDLLKSYQAYAFYDVGAVWNKDRVVGEERRDSLASAGLGTRFNLNHDISGLAEFSVPLTRDVATEGNNDKRFFFSLLKRF